MPKLDNIIAKFRSNRPAHTLFYVSANTIVRLDGDQAGNPVGELMIVDAECPNTEHLVKSLKLANEEFAQPLGGKVWVLYEGLMAITLGFASAQAAGLNEQLLQQALLYELEGVMGISTQHMMLAYQFLGEEDGLNQYWVCAAPTDLFERLSELMKKSRAKIMGLADPAGLPISLQGVDNNWLRVEFWRDSVFAIFIDKQGKRQIQSFSSNIQSTKAKSALERWKGRLPYGFAEETLAYAETEQDLEPLAERFRIDNPEQGFLWLRSWLASLAKEELSEVPVIKPGPRPELEYYIAGGIAAAVLLVCLAHFGWHRYEQAKAETEIASLTKVEADMKAIKDGMKKKQEEYEKLNLELKASSQLTVEMVPMIFDALRRRPADLLKTLANHRTEGLILEEIVADGDQLTVKGVVERADEANRMRSALEDHLPGLAWQVQPPSKTDLGYFENGGPWQFEIKLKDLGLQGFSQLSATATEASSMGKNP